MSQLFSEVTTTAARHHRTVSTPQLDALGVDPSLRAKWVRRGLLARAGPHSFVVVGSPSTPRQAAWCAAADAVGVGCVAGHTAAWLHRLDGFQARRRVEVLVGRGHRGVRLPHVVRTTSRPLGPNHTVAIDGGRCLTAERLILESPRFGFTPTETENAIDSAIRSRKVNETHLRERMLEAVRPGAGGALLREALIDTGGESRLERWFLTIMRTGGLPRPSMRVVVKAGSEFAARLDASFPGRLVVELEGARHSQLPAPATT